MVVTGSVDDLRTEHPVLTTTAIARDTAVARVPPLGVRIAGRLKDTIRAACQRSAHRLRAGQSQQDGADGLRLIDHSILNPRSTLLAVC